MLKMEYLWAGHTLLSPILGPVLTTMIRDTWPEGTPAESIGFCMQPQTHHERGVFSKMINLYNMATVW